MKKSKFLKKSLAMLLAVMLVVAMIPLSAAAASPELKTVWAGGGDELVQLGNPTDNVFTGGIDSTAQKFGAKFEVVDNNNVYYTDNLGNQVPVKVRNNIALIPELLVSDYTVDGKVVLKFQVADSTTTSEQVNYTIELTPETRSADNEIYEFKIDRVTMNGTVEVNRVPQLEDEVITATEVNITVPYDATATTKYEISALTVGDGNATLYRGAVAKDAELGVGDEVKDGDKLIAVAGTHTRTYTLNITVATGFDSFEIEEALDTIVFPDGIIVAMLPYGYTTNNEEFSVTPVFETDYDSTEVFSGSTKLTSGESQLTMKAVQGGHGGNTSVNTQSFNAFGDTSAPNDWADWVADYEDGNGSQFVKNNQPGVGKPIKVRYTDETEREYTIYFYEPKLNSEAIIESLTIGSEQAVIDQEAETITIELPKTNLAALNLNDGKTLLKMSASNNADISVPSQTAFDTVENPTDNTRAQNVNFGADATKSILDASNTVQVKVVSEDKLNTKWYALTVTTSDNYEVAKLNSLTLEGPNGEKADVQMNDDGTINVKVPYSVYDMDQFKGWKLFYTKTVGASATYAQGGQTVALPVTGTVLTGTEDFLADPSEKETGAEILLSIGGDEESANSRTYKMTFSRMDAKTSSKLDSFTLLGENDNDVFKAQFTKNGDKDVLDVDVAWSAWQTWTADQFTAIAKMAAEQNAKIFYQEKASGGKYTTDYVISLFNDDEEKYDATTVVKDSNPNAVNGDRNWVLCNGATIYVVSEQFWVELAEEGAIKNQGKGEFVEWNVFKTALKNAENKAFYTDYTLDIDPKGAETGHELTDLTLIDGTGWDYGLQINVEELTITGKIPYALTSELNDDGTIKMKDGKPVSVNPVFLAYDISDRAYFMAVDKDKEPKTKTVPFVDSYKIPTAGANKPNTSGNAVFADILGMDFSDYAELTAEHEPYVLISRKGDVYVYSWENGSYSVNDNVVANMVAVTNEDGKTAFDKYTFNLEVAPAKTGTDFTSFYFAEYPNFKGSIDKDTHTITVTLPYGSEYTYLSPVYETSPGAIVTVDDPELLGKPVYKNGTTDVNFTTSRKFTVIAESEKAQFEWTVKVQVADRFNDVKEGDWFYKDVMSAAQLGFLNGYVEDNTYKPYKDITRAEFANLLAKAMGYDESAYENTAFPDVADDHWAKSAIAFCADREIITGYEDGEFKPTKTISRQEVAVMLQRAFTLTGDTTDLYPDDALVAGWAEDAVYAVKHAGLMNGDAITGEFAPKNNLNRAQAATTLMNAHRSGLIK